LPGIRGSGNPNLIRDDNPMNNKSTMKRSGISESVVDSSERIYNITPEMMTHVAFS
jgi:hypothetical protein